MSPHISMLFKSRATASLHFSMLFKSRPTPLSKQTASWSEEHLTPKIHRSLTVTHAHPATHPDVGGGGHAQWSQTLVLALGVDDAGLKELLQVGHQHTHVKWVVHPPTVDGKLIQPMDEIPLKIFACGSEHDIQ